MPHVHRTAYPSVFDRISMEIGQQYRCMCAFSKYRQRVSRNYRNRSVNKCEFIASEVECWWSYCSLTFAYFKAFPGLKYTAGTSSDQTTTIQERTVGISKSSLHGALLLEKMFWGLQSRMTFVDVNKVKACECYGVPVLWCVCLIENVSSRSVLTK